MAMAFWPPRRMAVEYRSLSELTSEFILTPSHEGWPGRRAIPLVRPDQGRQMKEELIMAKSRSESARRRTQVKDLSKRNKKLSGKDMKKVKGKGGAPANPAWKDWFEKQGKGEVG